MGGGTYGHKMGPWWAQYGAPYWARVGPTLLLVGPQIGPLLGPCLGPYWGRYGHICGPILGPSVNYMGSIWDPYGVHPNEMNDIPRFQLERGNRIPTFRTERGRAAALAPVAARAYVAKVWPANHHSTWESPESSQGSTMAPGSRQSVAMEAPEHMRVARV